MSLKTMSREGQAVLPWVSAFLVWFVFVQPLREAYGTRLSEQAAVRRQRLQVDRAAREADALRSRIGKALGGSCRASDDPAVLRQRIVSSTAGLRVSHFALSVNGGAGGGASVEAEGAQATVMELTARLGDPGRGGFLRSFLGRDLGSRFAVSITTGVLSAAPSGFLSKEACEALRESPPGPSSTPSPAPSREGMPPTAIRTPPATPAPVVHVEAPSAPTPPFTVVGFLVSEGKRRVSVRMLDEVRVLSVGEVFSGWRCQSIDPDEGAVFVSATGDRAILRASPKSEP
jgi:hypothetical protein